MNRLYTYYPEFNDGDDLLWLVFEEYSSQIVGEFFFEEDAAELCNFLENGGGFSGFTPSFMLRKSLLNTDINEAFAAEFA